MIGDRNKLTSFTVNSVCACIFCFIFNMDYNILFLTFLELSKSIVCLKLVNLNIIMNLQCSLFIAHLIITQICIKHGHVVAFKYFHHGISQNNNWKMTWVIFLEFLCKIVPLSWVKVFRIDTEFRILS